MNFVWQFEKRQSIALIAIPIGRDMHMYILSEYKSIFICYNIKFMFYNKTNFSCSSRSSSSGSGSSGGGGSSSSSSRSSSSSSGIMA